MPGSIVSSRYGISISRASYGGYITIYEPNFEVRRKIY